ncbi:MAG: DNA-directed RNA polymerase subunit E' [archaeon GW2011_AR13]|nr:MAG: DNA-directed RNA polymerase subunit E' [archaeon GW2011_AR13]HIG95121.1 DNA-directed RNA polymerase subunit E'' [Nanoarchaeota archaeon]HIH63203.1 DNA-directed RNA polymerase subunit E'' [Nanoarchaeota archaeon]HIJ09307.1 DNA-directed RNA polymerase subunit E'' [Nanoarchaeota archaeon]
MAKPKACKICNTIFEEGEKCPACDSRENTEGFKGRIVILNPEKSEVAQRLHLKNKGNFAIKTR